ncbi:MAG: hypothetical protein IPP56_13535 [Bacteroidetes bacterium]|jgi:hypothetical protein|nr:hypothetical protein [Bacteroidota bacterium]MBK9800681.1 hypothetical protein [Bacteroidota bacterium]MBP7108892.1 hypothetical protein [Chitinophagaceae bacterium]MBP7152160.1 hypothetical protein [Paludibacteraceae bacterium]
MASELERLRARNAELEKRFDDMQRGNLLNTYLTIDGQHKSFNEQLTIGVILDENNKQKVVGRIDLFASKDAKEFDRARWWLENYLEQSKNLRELYKMLTEEEKKEADNTASSFDSVREKVSKELNGGRTGISN